MQKFNDLSQYHGDIVKLPKQDKRHKLTQPQRKVLILHFCLSVI